MPTILSMSSHTAAPAIGIALRALATAAADVFAAVRATLFSATDKLPLSPDQEAEQARALAFSYLKTDRRLADDLFAAADRHERLRGA